MKFVRRKKRVLGFPSFWISTLGFITCKYSIFIMDSIKNILSFNNMRG
jgi:hypothetical protein